LAPAASSTSTSSLTACFDVKDRASEKEAARQEGFAKAVETNWNAPDGTQADLFLIEFNGAVGAADFVSGVSEATAAGAWPTRPLTELAGIPAGEAWSTGVVNDVGDFRQTAWFSVGNIAVDLHYFTPGRADSAGLTRLAKAQYARLVGHVTGASPVPVSSAFAPAPSGKATTATATAADKARLLHDLLAPPKGSRPWHETSSTGATGVLTLQQLLVRYAPLRPRASRS